MATINWISPNDGFWDEVTNWSSDPNLPQAVDDVIIDVVSGTITVTHRSGSNDINSLTSEENFTLSGGTLNLDDASTINGDFTQSGGTLGGAGTLTINGASTWSGGTHAGSGTTNFESALSIEGAAGKELGDFGATTGRTLNINAGATWTGTGFLRGTSGSVINNATGSTFDIQTDADIFSSTGGATFNNDGTVVKSVGTDVTSIGIVYNNSGTTTINSGTLQFANDSTHTGTIDGSGTLAFSSGTHDVSGNVNIGDAIFSFGTVNSTGTFTVANTTTFAGGTHNFTGSIGGNDLNDLTITGGTVNFSTGNLLTADTFTQSGGTLTGSDDITVAGAATWSGGTHAGSGTTNFESALSIEGAAGKELGDFGATTGRTLNINAGATWTGTGFLRGTSDSVINNATGSTFDIQTDADIFSSTGGATFNNDGTVVKSVGTDVTSIGIVYNNSGTTTINSGTLQFANDSTHTGTIDGSGTLAFSSGTHDVSGSVNIGDAIFSFGTVNSTGTFTVANTTTFAGGTHNFTGNIGGNDLNDLTITGGTVNFSTGNLLTADTFTQSGGTLTGSDDITVAGAATWSGGTHAGSGTTNFESALSIEGAAGKELGDFGATTGRTLNINAGATWTGTGFLRGTSDSVINNATGSTFDIQTDADIFSSTGGATFNNDGTVVKSVGTDVTSIGIVYNNSGTTTINSGTVELTNGGTHTGTFNGSGTLDFGGGTHDLETGTDVTVADVDVTSGAVNINSGVDYNAGNTDISFGTVAIASGVTATTGTGSQSGGTLTGEGIFTVTDAFTLSGGTQSGNGTTNFEGSLSIEGAAGKEWGDFNATSGRTFNINAGATWTGTGFLRGTSGSVINNATDSTFDIQTDADLFISTGGATFNNSGTLLKSFGETANNQATDIDTDFTNQGTVEVQQGVLDFGGGYTQTSGTTLLNGGSLTRSTFLDAFDIQGGSVTGFGTITGDIDNAGTVAPGVSVGDIGTLQLTGDYTETATASIDIEIASATSFDRFEIGGDAAFDGTLNVSVLNSFFPSIGDSFEVLTFGAATNTAGLDFTGLQISTLDAVDDTEGTDEDTAFSGDLFDNDTDTLFFDTTFSATNLTLDVDGDVKTITAIEGDTNAVGSQLTLASGALLTVNADGTFDYNPNGQFESLAVGETGTDSFTYTIEDSFGTVDTATVTVTIDGVNDAPVAVDDDFTTDEDVPLSDTVFTNDSDIDSTTLTATLLTDVSDGSLTLNADGSFSYTPDANFNGTDSFTYQISDGDLTDTATVSLTVNPVNDDPTAVDNTTSTPENTAVVIDVLSNDSDVDGDSLTTTAVGTAGNGSASINPDGTVTYTPDAGFSGTDSFTYTISDGNGGTDTAAVTVTVSATANQDPVANDDSFSTDEDTDLSGDVFADNGNGADSDPDGDTLTATVLSDVSNGSLTLNGDGSFSYTPDANFNGTDSFTYQISDGELTDSATVSIMVDPVNDAPEAADDSSNTPENTAVTINVLDNDTDLDGDSLSIATVGTAGNGSVVDNGDGTVTYTPDTDFSGTDSFTYEVSDGNGGTDTALVTVSVSNENGVPDAVDDTFSTDEDTPLSDSVLANDTDPDGDALTVSLLTDVSDGSLSLNADGSFSYTPNADFNGTDSFTYEVSDGALTDTATVNITVNPVNDDPTAVDNTTSTPENTAVVIDVLSNDSDVDGDTLTITAVVATGNGNTVANDDGTITYTPNPNFTGSDTFVYEISDGNGGTDTATVNIAVNPVGTGSDLDIGLYDAGSDTLITLIEEGDEILASTIAGKKVTLAAFVPDDSTFTGQVESMFLDLNEGEVTRRENAEPYALFGDSQGNFRGQTDPFFEGDNTIEFDLYSKNGLRGDLLGTVTRNFTVVDDISGSADLTVGLFDADSDTLITEIEDGDEILASTIADRNLTIAAFVPDHTPLFGQVESIVLNLNDGQVTRTENVEPYSLFSNQGDDFKGGGVGLLPEGDNAIAFELYAKNGARGDLLDTITRNFAVVDDGV